MATVLLNTIEDTKNLGKMLATLLPEYNFPLLILRGELGTGKTTLARYIVKNFIKSESVEFSSPSFSIINYYQTRPPIAHCDLYRCGKDIPEELYECIEDENCQTIVEWGEYLHENLRPSEYLDIFFNMNNNTRSLVIESGGESAAKLLNNLVNFLNSQIKTYSEGEKK